MTGSAMTRTKSVESTLAEIIPICKKVGITRISDITDLDKLCVPNYSAVLPGTEDQIWVYNGKGTTKDGAKASALMEAIERYSSLSSTYPRDIVQGSYLQLSKSFDKVLHPDELVEPVSGDYNERYTITDFLPGLDLLTNKTVLVPAEIALYRYHPKLPAVQAFSFSHTNGLASGNSLEEAICHALCEVIERDAVSIADLCASSIDYNILERVRDRLNVGNTNPFIITKSAGHKFVDDSSIFSDVDLEFEFEPIGHLIKKFSECHVPLLIKEITQKDIGIPTFAASSIEWISHDYGYFAKGYGTHPDARVALIRAITEASQTRAANIQGARDDLKKIFYAQDDEIYKRKWQFMPAASASTNRKNTIKFSEIDTFESNDVLDDINFILEKLKKSGLKRVVIVDLTIRSIGVPVVRAIVPGLETFEVTETVMGRRAREHYRMLFHQ
jgi:thioglycine synthase